MELEVAVHPAAIDHLPSFITKPGETDVLLVVTGIFLLLAVIGIGILYLRLHALPEQLAHRGQKVQFEIVAVLALLALFTHNHIFWITALLLALIPLPDFTTPLVSMARSLRRMAGRDERPIPQNRGEPSVVPVPLPAAVETIPADDPAQRQSA